MRKRRRQMLGWACRLLAVAGLLSPAARAGETPELTVFVGKLTGVRELDYDCGRDCWNFDRGYALTYSVLEVLDGDAGGNEERFDFFGHYGLPTFTHYDTALLFVFKGEKTNVMARYLAFPVSQASNGDWVFCGDPYPEGTPGSDRKDAGRVRLRAPVALSPVTAGYRDDASWRKHFKDMKPGRRQCRQAVFVRDLATYFAPRAEPGYWRAYMFLEPQERAPNGE